METVLIDQFVVPEAAVDEFLRHAHFSANIVKTRPGFIEGYVFRRTAGDGRMNVVTTAVWASQAAMEEAKKSIPTEFAKIGFSPPEIMKKLGVQIERGVYQRAAY
jgi:heme-degrading monooxygenase HmoA